ncbi:MAG: T9SS type A sorting domain-containing protein [Aureispira sp.]|nr:T9SS type A sorting domain-containing protein [Aureispira sp.]
MKFKTSTKYFLGLALLFSGLNSQAQHSNELYNNGAQITVQNGAEVHVWGDVHMMGGSMDNDGYVKVQGNMYSDDQFQQRSTGGTGIVRLENSDVNTTERQFIQGSYAVRGGQAAINGDDGAFQHLQLANSQGIVYLISDGFSNVGGENLVADVKGSVDFQIGAVANNRIITRNVGLTGAIPFANGSAHDGIFGMMNNSPGDANFIDESVDLGGNNSTFDVGYIEGKMRRAISGAGGTYGYYIGLEPTGTNNSRGFQYVHLDFTGGNNYDVITGHFEAGSDNTSPSIWDCSGSTYYIDYFAGSPDHGEWVFNDITGGGAGPYEIKIWPQDHTIQPMDVYLITKDNTIIGTADDCGATWSGLDRNGFSGFSEFGVAGSTNLLETDIIDLSATPINNNYIQVDWTTSKEKDVDYFEIERSIDDMNFDVITSHDAVGNSPSQQSYSIDDNNVLPNTNYYYRIKVINADGTFEYTHSVVASLQQVGGHVEAIKVYPNPVRQGAITIDFTSVQDRDLNIVVYDAIGQLITSQNAPVQEGFNQFSVETTHWPSGVYFIHMVGKDFSTVKELVKGE